MAQRGVEVSYESIRTWCEKFGRQYARRIRRQRGAMGDTWHLDEVYLKIDGQHKLLWRAVDQEGQVLDVLVQAKRNKVAATRFFKKVLRGTAQATRQVVTDKLAAYLQPSAEILPDSVHTRDKGANNRAENSHQPTRQRERRMKRFKSAAQAQRFLSIFSEVGNLFALARYTLSAANHRFLLNKSLNTWFNLTQAGVAY
jgi:putative transposase